MKIANQIMMTDNPLVNLLGDFHENHIGYVYSMNFTEAFVLTNDAWKERVAGIPHNSFLIGSAFNPEKFAESPSFDQELILLRVIGPASLPFDTDLIKTRIEHNQRRTIQEVYTTDVNDGLDPITHDELQYGALRCRILGTFYMNNGNLHLGSDLENYVSSTRLRVFKPRGKSLGLIVNHVNSEVKAKALEEAKRSGFSDLPTPIEIGTIRYTSTARLHRSSSEELVPVSIQPSDFLSRRTAILGMTRTGKSNTVKTTVASVHLAALKDKIKIGQVIFDINGEYANATHHDDGSSIAEVFTEYCIRYRAVDTPGFNDLRTNFYLETSQALILIQELFRKETSPYSGQDLETFMSSNLEKPDPSAHSDFNRWQCQNSVFQCILSKAGYPPPQKFNVKIPRSKNLVDQLVKYANSQTPPINFVPPENDYVSLSDACKWFETIRSFNLKIRAQQKASSQSIIGIESSTGGNSWVDATLEAYLNILVRENTKEQAFGGYRAIGNYIPYHSSRRMGDVVNEVYGHLTDGKIVILDLSAGPVSVRTVLSKRIAEKIFSSSFDILNQGQVPPNMVIYVEEAHNLIGKKDDFTTIWPRIAKEGAKARISFVYATQEPSSIHPNILANTENWFVTHLNNDDELKALGKFYDFSDFCDSLKTAQDVGFARIKTLSSPFVVPTQIKRFTPQEIVIQLKEIAGISTRKEGEMF